MLAVDSLSELSIITPAAATSLGLPMIPCHQKFQPAGDHNELLCEKVVDVNILRMGDKTVKDVRLYVCDIEKSCAPAAGIIGLDLFSSLGIEIHGVPVNFPRPANYDEDFIEDTEVCATDPKWLDSFKAPPERLTAQSHSTFSRNEREDSVYFFLHTPFSGGVSQHW